MKTKYIIILLIIVLGACKKNDDSSKNNELFSLWYLLNSGPYISIRAVNNEQNTIPRSMNTLQDKDGDGYIEKYATPEAVKVDFPYILGWEEGEEPTLQNADFILGTYSDVYNPMIGKMYDLPPFKVNGEPLKLLFYITYNKKYKKIGLYGDFQFVYKFKDSVFKDKNYKYIQMYLFESHRYRDNKGKLFLPSSNIQIIYPLGASYYTRLYYPEDSGYTYCNSYEKFIKAMHFPDNIYSEQIYKRNYEFYCNGINDTIIYTDQYLFKDGKYCFSKYWFNDLDAINSPFSNIYFSYPDLFRVDYEDGKLAYGALDPRQEYFNDIIDYHNTHPQTTKLYESKYSEYINETYLCAFTTGSSQNNILNNEEAILKHNNDYLLENFELLDNGILLMKTEVENKEELETGNLGIIIDVTDVFMWETEHPEWDYYDRVNDAPKPELGKEIKVYAPRIRMRVEKDNNILYELLKAKILMNKTKNS